MANYLDKRELLAEMKLSKAQNQLTNRAVELLLKMVKEISRPLRYKYNIDRDDCQSQAKLDILLYWRGFNPEHPKANVFSYFTQMIKNGNGKGFNALYPEIKDEVKLVPISEQNGIRNM